MKKSGKLRLAGNKINNDIIYLLLINNRRNF